MTHQYLSSPARYPRREAERLCRGMGPRSAFVTGICFLLTGCMGTPPATPLTPHCPNTIRTIVTQTKPAVQMSYTEPSANAAGTALKTLAKTTIYYDLGSGRVAALEVPATSPKGGGFIKKTITIPLDKHPQRSVSICVTATDSAGHESAMTP